MTELAAEGHSPGNAKKFAGAGRSGAFAEGSSDDAKALPCAGGGSIVWGPNKYRPRPFLAAGGRRSGECMQPVLEGDVAAEENVRMRMRVNGEEVDFLFAPYKTLLEVLREDLDLTGTKHGCELGECGACAVLVDGVPVLSCLALALDCEGREIETIEGLARGPDLHPLQAAFADLGAAQCGYCTPGILMTAKALLEAEPAPSRERIKDAISGNLCRCTGYQQIFEAVEEAARQIREERRAEGGGR